MSGTATDAEYDALLAIPRARRTPAQRTRMAELAAEITSRETPYQRQRREDQAALLARAGSELATLLASVAVRMHTPYETRAECEARTAGLPPVPSLAEIAAGARLAG